MMPGLLSRLEILAINEPEVEKLLERLDAAIADSVRAEAENAKLREERDAAKGHAVDLLMERDALVQRNEAFWQEIERLREALEKIARMTTPVDGTRTAGGYPVILQIHAIAADALKGGKP